MAEDEEYKMMNEEASAWHQHGKVKSYFSVRLRARARALRRASMVEAPSSDLVGGDLAAGEVDWAVAGRDADVGADFWPDLVEVGAGFSSFSAVA